MREVRRPQPPQPVVVNPLSFALPVNAITRLVNNVSEPDIAIISSRRRPRSGAI
ncbi:hypothetical protein P0D96_45470 [Paraburkholderia sp. RL17-347-BIC-D]